MSVILIKKNSQLFNLATLANPHANTGDHTMDRVVESQLLIFRLSSITDQTSPE